MESLTFVFIKTPSSSSFHHDPSKPLYSVVLVQIYCTLSQVVYKVSLYIALGLGHHLSTATETTTRSIQTSSSPPSKKCSYFNISFPNCPCAIYAFKDESCSLYGADLDRDWTFPPFRSETHVSKGISVERKAFFFYAAVTNGKHPLILPRSYPLPRAGMPSRRSHYTSKLSWAV